MLQYFTNEQIINKPTQEEVDLESLDRKKLSAEYQKYMMSDMNLFTVSEQMNERSQINILKGKLFSLINFL